MNKLLLGANALLIGLSACSPMQETAVLPREYLAAGKKETVHGIPYFLPATVVPIKIKGEFQVLAERKDSKTPPGPKDQEYVLSLEVGAPKQIPDPNGAVFMQYNLSAASDDQFRLAVNSNGLLGNIKSTSADKTGEVLLKLVELAKEAAKATTVIGMKHALTTAVNPDDRREACFNLLQNTTVETEINITDLLRHELSEERRAIGEDKLDPDERANRQAFDAKLQSIRTRINTLVLQAIVRNPAGIQAKGDLIPALDVKNLEAWKPPTIASASARPDEQGVAFRQMVPRFLTLAMDTSKITFGAGTICDIPDASRTLDNALVLAAHPQRTFLVDTSRGALVTKRVDLLVTDGVLTGIEVDKPSELLAIVSLPVNILKAIVAIPAELLTFKVTNVNAEKSLTAAEVQLIQQQIELIKQKQALEDAQKASGKAN